MNIEYRDYRAEDLSKYKLFCIHHFGLSKYQSNTAHLKWLEANETSFFKIAVLSDKIIGCIHGYEAPIPTNKGIINFMVLHDLAVDKNYKGIGFKLMRHSIYGDKPVILAHANGKMAMTYKKIGSNELSSYWARKFFFPYTIFNKKKLLSNINKTIKIENSIKIINNKNKDHLNLIKNLLIKLHPDKGYNDFFDWRFLNSNSPLTYFAFDNDMKNLAIFSIGFKSLIPFSRIYSIINSNQETYDKLIKGIEIFSKKFGIPLVYFTVIGSNTNQQNIKYKKTRIQPFCGWFSKNTVEFKDVYIDGFSTDLAFNGYW